MTKGNPRQFLTKGLAVLTLSTLFTACGQSPSTEMPNGDAALSDSESFDITQWPTLDKAPTYDADVEARVDDLLAQMTLEQKVGQMTQAEITWVTPEEVKQYHLGSVLNGGGTFLHGKRHATVEEWVAYMDAIYDASMDTSDGGLPIPVTYGIDAVHGNNKFGAATIFPHNIGLGAARNPELMKQIGQITALEVLVTGIDWTFAPTLAIVRDDRWGRTYESYSEDPSIVAEYARAMVEGIQGKAGTNEFLDDHHVYATAKHWVGDGGTDKGIDQGDNLMSEADLVRLQAAGYFPAIEAGIQSIMASHNGWHGKKLHGHKYLLTDVLKNQLGFDGFIIGDWNAHGNVAGCTNDSCAQAVNAGLDMFMVVEDYKAFIDNTIADVKSGVIPESRIDDAVRRILRVKIRSGLFEKGRPSSRPYAGRSDLMGAPAHREVAAQAVRESLVLLKNNNQLLPLSRQQNILVAGDGADNMAKQAGGWTISWQSTEVTKEDLPGATTILDGIRNTVESSGGRVQYSEDGSFEQTPDVAIVVFGENPYAEWQGDIKTLAYQPFSGKDAQLLESLKAQGIPVVSVFLSGRPLWVNRELNASDAFVAAWLPGSEGAAVADVLFRDSNGAVQHDMTGKLSFSWPRLASQTVLNIGDADYDPLFAYGYGLSYSDNVTVDTLDTDNDFEVKADLDAPYAILEGTLSAPWQLQVRHNDQQSFLDSDRADIGGVAIMEADKKVQGDAREFRWHGEAPATVAVSSPWYRLDLSPYVHSGGQLRFDVRTLADPSAPVTLDMGCGQGLCGNVDIRSALPSAKSGEWRTITVDLMCFAREGAEFERASLPFAVTSANGSTLRFANIAYLSASQEPATFNCTD